MIEIRRKSRRFEIRLSDDDFTLLTEQARISGLSKADVLYAAWKKVEIKPAPPAEYVELIMQVRRVGSNINQLLKLANAKGIIIANDLRIALEKNYQVEDMLWNVFAVK